MKVRKLTVPLGVVAVLALGAAVAATDPAHAAVGGNVTGLPISSTNSQTIAGWYATANNANDFPTHLSATLGSDGQPTLGNLAKSTVTTTGVTTPGGALRVSSASTILAGEGMGLVNSDNGLGVEVGIVNLGNGLMDVVAGEGTLTTPTPFGFAGLVGANDAYVLLANQPIAESVDVDLQMTHGYSNGPVGDVIASARVAHNGNWHRQSLGFTPVVLDEVQSGVINGSQPSVALNVTPSQVPLPNTSRTSVPNELGRLAHVDVSANVRGGHEFHGAQSTGGAPLNTSTVFTGFPVYTYSAVTAGEQVDLAPTTWASDNFAIEGGLPISS
jgi:hypothetical protein